MRNPHRARVPRVALVVQRPRSFRLDDPELDQRDASAQKLLAAGLPPQLSYGHSALQAESLELWFRNLGLKPLAN